MQYLITFLMCFAGWSNFAFAEESCECPKLGCDPCSFQKGITFFTNKCGPNNEKMKSCGRPTCLPIDEATKECPNPPAASTTPREPIVIKAAAVAQEAVKADVAYIGNLHVVKGDLSVVKLDGSRQAVKGDAKLIESDSVESGAESSGLITFEGGNKIHVHPNTKLQVKEYKNQEVSSSRKVLLHLLKGKVRNQVEQKYNGETSYYRITTPAAVAGVRGTDFVLEHSEDKEITTRVEGLSGKIVLASLDEREMREILRGEGATFTAEAPPAGGKEKDYADFIRRGKLSPVYKIPSERLRDLEYDSRVDVARGKGPKKAPRADAEICDKPKGLFNQCSWTRGAGADVSCVRRRCNANGHWGDETVVPVSAGANCPPQGSVVKGCDY